MNRLVARRDLPHAPRSASGSHLTPGANFRRDRQLAAELRDAYQKGWDAVSTGQFFANDIRPLMRRGRKISPAVVQDAATRLRVPSEREFGPWPVFVRVALRTLLFSLRTQPPERDPKRPKEAQPEGGWGIFPHAEWDERRGAPVETGRGFVVRPIEGSYVPYMRMRPVEVRKSRAAADRIADRLTFPDRAPAERRRP